MHEMKLTDSTMNGFNTVCERVNQNKDIDFKIYAFPQKDITKICIQVCITKIL